MSTSRIDSKPFRRFGRSLNTAEARINTAPFGGPHIFQSFALAVFACLIVVAPNALREIKALIAVALLIPVAKGLLALPAEGRLVMGMWLGVTILYLLVGADAAEPGAFWEVVGVYCVAPIFWVGLSTYIVLNFRSREIATWIRVTAWLSVASIAGYYLLFYLGGRAALEAVVVNPWITLSDSGVVEARLHVSGSLSFLVPAVFALSVYAKSKPRQLMLMIVIVIAVVATGRAAVFIACGFALAVFYLQAGSGTSRSGVLGTSALIVVVGISVKLLFDASGVSVINTMNEFSERIREFGGLERLEQVEILVESSMSNYFMGAGHGVPVDYIRSIDKPWRYEMMMFATLHRVGVIGLLIYLMPVAISLIIYGRIRISGGATALDDAIGFGAASFAVSTFTNPLIESVEFQWMYFLPFVYFLFRRSMPSRVRANFQRLG